MIKKLLVITAFFILMCALVGWSATTFFEKCPEAGISESSCKIIWFILIS
jgi:hypothetical protein